jgi:type I restriction enzyme S subunit
MQYEYYRNELLSLKDKSSTNMLPLYKIVNSISSGKNKTRLLDGDYPVYGSTGVIAHTDKYVYDKTQILVARVGANAGYTHIAQGKYDVSDNTLIIDVKDDVNLRYLYYQLCNINLNKYAKGGGQPLVTAGQIKQIEIPVPSMEEQNRIVAILDRFDTLCNDISKGLPAEIEGRRKQYEYYRDKLLNFRR